MPGLVPGIHATGSCRRIGPTQRCICMQGGWVYMMSNRRDGTLYVGVTNNLARRAWEHREGIVEGFTKRYGLKRLVYAERHDDIRDAIQREKSLKRWPRAWKVRLLQVDNPTWDDLYVQYANG
jgi:putative endonuclease